MDVGAGEAVDGRGGLGIGDDGGRGDTVEAGDGLDRLAAVIELLAVPKFQRTATVSARVTGR